MRNVVVLFFSLAVVLVSIARADTDGGAACSGFPWTVTATPYGGDSVAVRICGTFAGCRPHNPQFSVSGSEIQLTLTSAEGFGGCQCIAVVDTFSETVIIPSLAPGDYTVTAILIDCGQASAVGGTTFVFGAASAIPALNPAAAAAFAFLLAAVAVLRLRS